MATADSHLTTQVKPLGVNGVPHPQLVGQDAAPDRLTQLVDQFTAIQAQPVGLLRHENITWGVVPAHLGMRQYWRDFDSLERWARSDPHALWWRGFLKDGGGTGFWHETYFVRGGFEAIYRDMPGKIGLTVFAPEVAKRGSMFSARERLGLSGEETKSSPIPEEGYDAYVTNPVATSGASRRCHWSQHTCQTPTLLCLELRHRRHRNEQPAPELLKRLKPIVGIEPSS